MKDIVKLPATDRKKCRTLFIMYYVNRRRPAGERAGKINSQMKGRQAMDASEYIVIIAGLGFIVGSIFQLARRFFLKKRCTAQVGGNIHGIELNEHEHKRDDDYRKSVSYSIAYDYSADGVEYEKKRRISKRQHKVLGKHDGFTVFYDPSKPKRHYVLELKFRMLATLGLIALGAILLYYSFIDVLLI